MNPAQLLIQEITDHVKSAGPSHVGVAAVLSGDDIRHYVTNGHGQVLLVGSGHGLMAGFLDKRYAKPVLEHSRFSRLIEDAQPLARREAAFAASLENLRLPHLAHIHEQIVEGRERPPIAGVFPVSELPARLTVSGALRREFLESFAAGDIRASLDKAGPDTSASPRRPRP